MCYKIVIAKPNQIIQTHILCAYIVPKCIPILYEVYQQEIDNYCCFKFSVKKKKSYPIN